MFIKTVSRAFSTNKTQLKAIKLKNTKTTSSNQWLTRQLSDPYVEKAKMLNYRCRSAFKLVEMNDRFNFFTPGQIIVDCGAAPGSWSQVAVQKVNADGSIADQPKGVVISIDKQPIYPIEGATVLGNMDFTTQQSQERLIEMVNNRRLDGVISDMAPNCTGVRDLDNENIIKLCYLALRFAVKLSKIDGFLIVKLWQSNDTKQLETNLSRFYNNVRTVKPHSSRTDSAEIFLLARNFKGLKFEEIIVKK